MRLLSLGNLRWVIRHRAWTPWYLVRYWRFWRVRVDQPAHRPAGAGLPRPRRGALRPPRLWPADPRAAGCTSARAPHCAATRARCASGGRARSAGDSSVNCYLDVEIGASALFADHVYVSDFDHRYADPERPINDQGIVKSRVRIGSDVWLGTKVTVAAGW